MRWGRQHRRAPVLVVGLAMLLMACGGSTTATNTAPMVVGELAPLTGPVAGIGQQDLNGAKAAIAYINSHGGVLGRQLQTVVIDTAANPTQSAAGTRQLLDQKVTAIVGDVISSGVLAEMAVVDAASQPVPVMTGGTSPAIFDTTKNPWAFGVGERSDLSTQAYVDYFLKVRGIKTVGIMYETSAYGTSSRDAALSLLKAAGVTPAGLESFAPTAPDVTVQLRRLQSEGAQGLFLFTFGPGLITVLKGLNALNWHPPSVTAPSVADPATVAAVGAAALADVYGGPTARGLVTVPGQAPSALTTAFLKGLKSIEGVTALSGEQLNASYGFDAFIVLAAAINRAGSTDPAKIRAALESGKPFEGARTTFTYSPTDHFGQPYSSYVLFRADVVCVTTCTAAPGTK
jgi:branched-chain amino acid transport system substrate-binding protein